MKKAAIILGILGGVGLLTWLTVYIIKQSSLLQKICTKFGGYRILSLAMDNSSIQVNLILKNPSNVDITINSYDFDAYINDKKVSKIISNVPQQLVANGSSTLVLVINFSPKQVIGDVVNIITSGGFNINTTKIRIYGNISVTAVGIPVENYPVDISETLAEMLAPSTGDKC